MLTFSTAMLLACVLSEVVASEASFAVAGVQAHLAVARASHTGVLRVEVARRTALSALPVVQETLKPSSICVASKQEKDVSNR